MDVLVLIPARGGSKNIPKKNIYPLGEHPLIAYSILAARLSAFRPRIVVSTDSNEIADISRSYGAEVPFLRPVALAGDRSTDLEFVTHALTWFKDTEHYSPDLILHLRPTTPLRNPDHIDEAISLFLKHPDATSLRSAHKAPESPMKWFQKSEGGFFRPYYDLGQDLNAPRQSFLDAYIPDGYVDILNPRFITETGLLHGDRILAFESPPCVEVDTLDALAYLAFEIQKNTHPLLTRMGSLLR